MCDGLEAHTCEVCHGVTLRWVLRQNWRGDRRYFCDDECLARWIAQLHINVSRETVLEGRYARLYLGA